MTLDQVFRAWHRQGTLPGKPIVLTFDDGYSSQYRNAAPALRRYGWPGVLNLERQGLASPLGDPLMLSRIRVDGRKPAADVLRALRPAAVPTVGPMTAGHPVL